MNSEHGIGGRTGAPTQDIISASAPRPVTVGDVAKFAKKDCSRCHGAGHVTRIHHANRTAHEGGEVRGLDACACAVRRFKKKHDADVLLVDGVAMWAPGKAPSTT
jgi:hypothetical protein